MRGHLAELDALFACLQSRALNGELCKKLLSPRHGDHGDRRNGLAPLRERASLPGAPGRVSNRLRRAERAVAEASHLRRLIKVHEQRPIKTKNEV
jgi:hypothetical protein